MMDAENRRFALLLEDFMAGRISARDREELERLAGTDPRRKALYEACVTPLPQSRDESLSAFERHWQLIENPIPPIRTPWIRWKVAAVAAVVLMAVGIVGYQWFQDSAPKRYFTELGQRRQFKLPDGTTVWLNGGSSLTLGKDYNKGHRHIIFRGEGLFDIKADPTRPFQIDAGGAAVSVLGTVFNLRAYEEEGRVETTLISGKVALTLASDPENRIMLDPGKKVVIHKDRLLAGGGRLDINPPAQSTLSGEEVAIFSDMKVDENEQVANDVLWTSNKLVFDGDQLDVVASKLTKWYGVDVQLTADVNPALKFSGIFEDLPLDSVLQTLAYTGSIRFKRDGDVIVITN